MKNWRGKTIPPRRIDLDKHFLLQLGEPFVRARLFAAAFILDQTA
jgi:hypothetical protein